MKARGVALPWGIAMGVCIGLGLAVGRVMPYGGSFQIIRGLELTAGVVLVVAGLATWLWSLSLVLPAFTRQELVTVGPYAWSRNPAYAAWVFLVVPGYALIRDSWPILLMTVPIYAVTSMLVRKEESFLANAFGDSWHAYYKTTPRLIPRPPARRRGV
jgi:protein-S-isoprenylcysteine O-methyltransferase Ste14